MKHLKKLVINKEAKWLCNAYSLKRNE